MKQHEASELVSQVIRDINNTKGFKSNGTRLSETFHDLNACQIAAFLPEDAWQCL